MNTSNTDNSEDNVSPAVKAINLILEDAILGHTPDKKAYISFIRGDIIAVESMSMKDEIQYRFFRKYDKTLSNSAAKEAMDTLRSMAIREGEEWALANRSASEDGYAEIDLCRPDNQRVCITPEYVSVIPAEEGRYRFKRSPDMLSLPLPSDTPDLSRFRPYINVDGEEQFTLLMILIAFYICGYRSFPLMALVGSPGAGKSEAARFIRLIIDPNSLPLGSIPDSDRDAFIEATSYRLIVLDNIQVITNKRIADRYAKISTGGGMRPRKLYEDNGTNTLYACSPILMTALEPPTARSDLADRTLTFYLVRIPEDQRLPGRELEERFAQDYPHILAGFYDLISKTMAKLQTMNAADYNLPRMADFGLFGIAAAKVLCLEEGAFMRLYSSAIQESAQGVVDANPLLGGILSLMDQSEESIIRMTPRALLRKLTFHNKELTKSLNERSLGKRIRELTPMLQLHGITCRAGRGKERYIELSKRVTGAENMESAA